VDSDGSGSSARSSLEAVVADSREGASVSWSVEASPVEVPSAGESPVEVPSVDPSLVDASVVLPASGISVPQCEQNSPGGRSS